MMTNSSWRTLSWLKEYITLMRYVLRGVDVYTYVGGVDMYACVGE